MGAMSEKRKRNREEYLRKLAGRAPDRFRREWSKRLNSYKILQATLLTATAPTDEAGPMASAVAGQAVEELARIGTDAVGLDRKCSCPTEITLNHTHLALTARWADPRLCKLQQTY